LHDWSDTWLASFANIITTQEISGYEYANNPARLVHDSEAITFSPSSGDSLRNTRNLIYA
jgi:hypothetical protein